MGRPGSLAPDAAVSGCDCLEKLAEPMRERGLWIGRTMSEPAMAALDVSWYPGYKPKRGERPPTMLATYCPFCGAKYEE
jgi:hypothetical protein